MRRIMSRYDDLLRTGGALAGRIGDAALDAIADARAPCPGDELGPFRIVREVGRGGMAVVFLAERADGQFRQQVALKWILGLAASPTSRELFRRERQILADLAHPNIARLVDGGETFDGQLWFAMEWIEGEAIDAWCARNAVDTRARVRLLLQVAGALRFAHGRLLVHCDVKPSNILVDADGRAHLIDFGVARLTGRRDSGMATGYTPAVASPEQRAGLAAGVPSDVYQLGLLLARLLGASCSEPLEGAAGEREVDRRIDWPEAAPPELRSVVERATRRDPGMRYEDIASVAADCVAWLERRPVSAHGAGLGYRLRCQVRRNPALALVSGLSLLAVVGLSAAFTWRLAQERDQARTAADRAEAVTDFMVRLFRGIDPAGNPVAAEAARGLAVRGEALGADLAHAPEVHAAVLAVLAEVQQSLGDYASAERLARRSLDVDPAAPGPAWAMRMAQLAQALSGRGDYDGAIEVARSALARTEGVADAAGARARLLAALAASAQFKGELALAVASAESLLADTALGDDSAEFRGIAELTLAYVDDQRGEPAAALDHAERARALLARALGAEHVRVAALDAFRAYLLLGVGRDADAGSAADAAVAALTRTYGPEHARLSYALTNQALARLRLGDVESAVATGERALAMCQRLLGEVHAQCAVSAQVLATALHAANDASGALRLLRQVLAVRRATLSTDHAYVGFAELNLAQALCEAGDASGASVHASEAERILAGLPADAPERERLAAVSLRCARPDQPE
jgi:tetratricopeptide (TPR) repeat protein